MKNYQKNKFKLLTSIFDDEPEQMSQAINKIVNNKIIIEKIYNNIKVKYNEV